MPGLCHLIAQTYLGKVTKGFQSTSCGSEMAAKKSIWGYFYPPVTIWGLSYSQLWRIADPWINSRNLCDSKQCKVLNIASINSWRHESSTCHMKSHEKHNSNYQQNKGYVRVFLWRDAIQLKYVHKIIKLTMNITTNSEFLALSTKIRTFRTLHKLFNITTCFAQ